MSLDALILKKEASFWPEWRSRARAVASFDEVMRLGEIRRRALAQGLGEEPGEPLRIALLGGYALDPFRAVLEVALRAEGFAPAFFEGEYENYTQEVLSPPRALDEFRPQVIFLLPSETRCRYHGNLADEPEKGRAQAMQLVGGLLALAEAAHARHGADIFLGNFAPPSRFDPGAYRVRTLGSDWTFRRLVNLELGLRAPGYVQICDVDFLATRRGSLASRDDRAWLASKQAGSPDFLLDLAREVATGARLLRRPMKKLLVLDLDNTCWGGIVAEEGIEEIAIGDRTPTAQAFTAFQRYCLELKNRGVLLAVCSKNDYAVATQPFLNHPEMTLRLEHFVSFKANWNPKGETIRAMAQELGLTLDSIVFVDDNPAEIENVRQLAPEVTAIRLGPEPADYVGQLMDARLFETRSLTKEDAKRTEGYHQEAQRRAAMSSSRSHLAFLQSLAMEGAFAPFTPTDFPRVAQLINKTNQFNVTARRLSEGEVSDIAGSRSHFGVTMRLADKFGDYGLIAAAIVKIVGELCTIETWVMSCRVLQRGVEEAMLNEIARIARARGGRRLVGAYTATDKNGIVKDLYPRLGFATVRDGEYALALEKFSGRASQITIRRREAPAAESA